MHSAALLLALSLSLSGNPAATGRTFDPAKPAQTGGDLEAFISRYSTDIDSLRSFYPSSESAEILKRREGMYSDWMAKLKAVDFDGLNQDGKVDYVLLRTELEYQSSRIAFTRTRNAETERVLPFARRIIALESERYKIEPIDPEKVAGQLDELTKEIKAVRARIQKGLDQKADPAKAKNDEKPEEAAMAVSQVLALRSANAARELRGTFEHWFGYYDGFKPMFSWWNRTPYQAARKELDEYEKFLRGTVAGVKEGESDPLIGDPIGREALLADIRHEMIPYSPEELVKIAEKEFAWCEVEMKKASREMGFGGDWKKALEKVKQDHVPPGEQDQLVAQQARDAIDFVDKRDLVTIEPLCRETWRVEMLDAQGQRVLPFAAYGGQQMLVAYPLELMDNETKQMSLRGNNVHFTRIVTPHELIPGHHLQGYMAQRHRAYRSVFGTPFLVEGWALYWEMLLWNLNYQRNAADRVGMLFWRMHRCARIIVSLDFHLGKMKPQEMIDFLVERVGHEKFTATSEVRRFIGGSYSPLYQCAYMIGGLQLRALYRDTVGEPAGAANNPKAKAFHDAILKEGPVPVEMIRASLKGTRLTREYVPGWRFAGQ